MKLSSMMIFIRVTNQKIQKFKATKECVTIDILAHWGTILIRQFQSPIHQSSPAWKSQIFKAF